MTKISLIVPVYNVEQYIKKCVESLLHQDIEDYEIIIINDGSKDNSIEIIEKNFQSSKIKIFEQKNQGLSAARNKGLQEATGDLIWFIDSDDCIEENCLNEILSSIGDNDLMVMTNGIKEKDGVSSLSYKGFYDIGKKTKKDLLKSFIPAAPYYIFRRKLLVDNNLFFKKGVFHEDMEFTPRAIFKAESFVYFTKPLYHQLAREGSITHSFNPKRLADVLSNAQSLYGFYLENGNHVLSKMLLYSAGKCIIYGVIESKYMNEKDRYNYIKSISENHQLIEILVNSPAFKHNVQGKLLKLSPSIYIYLFDFLLNLR